VSEETNRLTDILITISDTPPRGKNYKKTHLLQKVTYRQKQQKSPLSETAFHQRSAAAAKTTPEVTGMA